MRMKQKLHVFIYLFADVCAVQMYWAEGQNCFIDQVFKHAQKVCIQCKKVNYKEKTEVCEFLKVPHIKSAVWSARLTPPIMSPSASLLMNSGVSCRAISKEMGLQGLMSARQLKKKWGNLKDKYKVSLVKISIRQIEPLS